MYKAVLNSIARLIILFFGIYLVYDNVKMYLPQTIEATGLEPYRVAHAGGGINTDTYTNSYEALNHSLKNGFTYFEIDFIYTNDNQLVCLHDWEDSFYRNFGYIPSDRLSLKDFLIISKSIGKYSNCTIDGLSKWMTDHPNSVLITDIKENNVSALKHIYRVIPNSEKRVIPQIYDPRNFHTIKKIGFNSIIWTLYQYNGSDQSVIYWLSQFDGKVAITMPKYRAKRGLGHKLKEHNITSFTHTINSTYEMNLYKNKHNISEIYTDFVYPND